MTNSVSLKVRVQKIGAFLSAEVMPNIGVFIGWGILAALVIPTGWLPNEKLNVLVAPTMKYLVPALIGYTGGFNIHGKRGGVIGAFATMGIILGAEMNM
ncbi:MAG: PTS mannitol transporter subunit IIBC, partial [Enterococcus hulanensis]